MTFLRIMSFTATVAFVTVVAHQTFAADAGCTGAVACETCDVSNYAPSTMAKPIGPSTGACTSSDISAFVDACIGTNATSTTCTTWQGSASSTCLACVVTDNTASSWGALVCDANGCNLNIPGCADLALGQVSKEKQAGGSGSCGDALSASYGCEDYACSACTSTDFDTCTQDAIANECASYVASVESTNGACAVLNGDAAPPAINDCFPQTDGDDVTFVTYMCGGATVLPTDGGTASDSGTPKDSGAETGDGGTTTSNSGGCHCDAAGSPSSDGALAIVVSSALVLVGVRRRKNLNRT